MSSYEILGTVLGVLGVWLMIRQNVWGWPVGLVQVSVYAWVFFTTKLYSDALLQVFFFAIQSYGWWHWLRGQRGVAALPVTRLRVQGVLGWCAVGVVATAVWGELMRRNTDAALPHWDAFVLVFSLIAQWLQARKRLECWAGWMVVNVVAIGVYWERDLRMTAALYVMFFGLAVAGHVAWRRSLGSPATQAHGSAASEQEQREKQISPPKHAD